MSATPWRWQTLALLLLMPLPLFLPYLWLDRIYFWANPDSIFYINIYTSYRDALWRGELFPHWIAATNFGFGNLAFYQRSPLPYSLTAIISAPFFLSDEHQYLLGIYASQVFAGWTMWRWLCTHYDRRTALLGALLYVLVPYKFLDLYRHFNLAEFWAIAFIPLWLHAAEMLNTRRGMFLYGLAAALTFHAHLLTALSIGPLALVYALHCNRWQWRSALKPLAGAHLLALGLVASYLAALIACRPWYPAEGWDSGKFNPINNLYHVDGFMGAYALVLMWLVFRARKPLAAVIRGNSLFFWSMALVALYIVATPLSIPLWEYARWMDVFQFPFARLQPGMGAITALLGACLLSVRFRDYTIGVAAVYVLFIGLCLFHVNMVYKRPNEFSMRTHDVATRYRIIPGPVYLPVWAPVTANDLLLGYKRYSTLPLAEVKDGEATTDNARKGDGWLELQAHVKSGNALLVVSQFYIPAWQALVDGKPAELGPYSDGFIALHLPQGDHQVRLAIGKSAEEWAGDIATWFTLALYAFCFMRGFRRAQS